MEVITMSGVLQEDSELKVDKKGRNYIRFKVVCHGVDPLGNERLNTYMCYTYNTQFSSLKKGDLVFVVGPLTISRYKESIRLEVYAEHINSGVVVK